MDNVTLGAIALGVSVVAFLLVNVLSVQAYLERKSQEEEAAPGEQSMAGGARRSGHLQPVASGEVTHQPRRTASR